MTGSHPTLDDRTDTSAARHDGNDVDLHYLQQSRAALGPVLEGCRTVATRGGNDDVRALARSTWVEQADRLAAVSARLREWGTAADTSPHPASADALAPLHGAALDRAFADQLTSHAHASIDAARVELVAGAGRVERQIAEDAIHAEDRRLARLALLAVPAAGQ